MTSEQNPTAAAVRSSIILNTTRTSSFGIHGANQAHRESPILMVYMKPRVKGQKTFEQDNKEKIQSDADLQRRFSKSLSLF